MKRLFVAALIFMAACSKKNEEVIEPVPSELGEQQVCDFGIREFNLYTRPPVEDMFSGNKPKWNGGGGGGNPPPAPAAGVLLLDFDGDIVSNTVWNSYGPINCAPANLSAEHVTNVFNRVTNDFSPFNINVTTDQAVYDAANPLKRQKVIITESWEWFGQAGGVSFTGSFTGGTYTPAFVFSSLLNYSVKKIAEAISHESGHTLGLRHQAVYNSSCVKLSDYNYGQGSGEIGWAPIMGVAYNQNLSLWHRGPNSLGCNQIQDDAAVIAAIVGYKPDDIGNNFATAGTLSSAANGILSQTNDIDMYRLVLAAQRTLILAPYSVDINNSGANIDMQLKIYNSEGTLLQTIDNTESLTASISLAPGVYYIGVGNIGNPNCTTYGMLGKYTLALN